jgi:translation elongation factor EF-1alpha
LVKLEIAVPQFLIATLLLLLGNSLILKKKVDKRTGKVIEEFPKSIKTDDAAIIKLIPSKPMIIKFPNKPSPLGRLTI